MLLCYANRTMIAMIAYVEVLKPGWCSQIINDSAWNEDIDWFAWCANV